MGDLHLIMVKRTGTVYTCSSNRGFSSSFCVDLALTNLQMDLALINLQMDLALINLQRVDVP